MQRNRLAAGAASLLAAYAVVKLTLLTIATLNSGSADGAGRWLSSLVAWHREMLHFALLYQASMVGLVRSFLVVLWGLSAIVLALLAAVGFVRGLGWAPVVGVTAAVLGLGSEFLGLEGPGASPAMALVLLLVIAAAGALSVRALRRPVLVEAPGVAARD